MPATYEPIATTTLGSAASTITFSSIPSTYTDLRLVLVATTTTETSCYLQFNSDTGTNYSRTELSGNGSAAFSSGGSSQAQISLVYSSISTTIPSFITLDIFSYAGNTFKTCLTSASQDVNGSGLVGCNVGLWRSTSAITSVNFIFYSGSFAAGTTATLYGIKNA
jgi:hypothetical protein